ncbi:MAG: hypothetical protein GQ570_08480 [Helicobacteraceae bacterium]|nr:hypothetical protein [Helicobacteraceae bacterium]
MLDWNNLSSIKDFTGYHGFTYVINYADGTNYYGKKDFITSIKRKLGKKELAERTDKRTKTYKTIVKESNWRTYNGSTKNSKGKTIKDKWIIEPYKTKRELTYREAELLFKYNVLFDDKCLNENILGKFFSNVGD